MMASIVGGIGRGIGPLAPYGAIENVTVPEGLKSSQDIMASAVTVLLGLAIFGTSVRNMLQPPNGGIGTSLNVSTTVYMSVGAFITIRDKAN